MRVADTMTNSIREMSVLADEKIKPVVRALNRQLFFTDVPCGALKIQECTSRSIQDDEDATKGLFRFCGSLERVFCFSDLKDIEEADLKKLRSMQSIGDKHVDAPQKDFPVVETVDTESCSDDDSVEVNPAGVEGDAEAAKVETENKVEAKTEEAQAQANGKEQVEAEAQNPEAKDEKTESHQEVTKDAVRETLLTYSPKTIETAVVTPANTLQASSNKATKGNAPKNSLQAAREAKKEKQEARKKEKQAKQEAAKEAKMKKQKAANDAKKNRRRWALFRRSPQANP